MRVLEGGAGRPLLLLLHGLGATADVWDGWRPVLAEHWPGRWRAPDLPGHGGSPPLERYSFGTLAAALADLTEDGAVVVGHSLGGVLALTLGSGWFGAEVRTVLALGTKVAWTPEELAKARALADRPPRTFGTRDEAATGHLRMSGLAGLLDPADPAVTAGLREDDTGWRLALDQRAFGVGAPDLPGLLAACRADVLLARGERDRMVTADQLGPAAVTLPGLGHNAHVEDPAAVYALLSHLPLGE